MKKIIIFVTLFSSLAMAHDSVINFRGVDRNNCLAQTRSARDLLTLHSIGYVITASCDYCQDCTSTQIAEMTMIHSSLVANSYPVSGMNGECDNNIQESLTALEEAGKVAFISMGCDYVDNSSNLKSGGITVISDFNSQLISR